VKVTTKTKYEILSRVNSPQDLKKLDSSLLPELAKELRELLIDSTSKNGGHVSPNLGVTELTIALHRVFESPKDKIIWDIGHQAYIHKMLTGRWQQMHTIRQFRGLKGFCDSKESEHDIFNAGHAGTSLSIATGFAISRDYKREKYSVVPIIGDGSIGSGMSLEALNHLGYIKKDVTIIFNDNDFSIAPNVGAISGFTKYLDETPPTYTSINDLAYLESKLDEKAKGILKNIKKDIHPYIYTPSIIFEKLGFRYFGPYDGHDIELLTKVFEQSKKRSGPQIIHVRTIKGKGYQPAEQDPELFHGIGPFDKNSGIPLKTSNVKTYPKLVAETLIELAKKNKKIVAISPGTPLGTGIRLFEKAFPDRFYDVGIAEQHAVGFAAGLAQHGFKPVVSIYSTFLQRAYDQIVHDVCIQDLPVVFLCRSGLVEDGETHHGVFDVSYLRHIPNLILMSPRDADELVVMIKNAFTLNKPVCILHPKGEIVNIGKKVPAISVGKSELVIRGKDLALFAFGSMVKPALEIADKLMAYGIQTCVINTRFAKHIDKELIQKISTNIKKIVTLEENIIHGGVGSRVLEILSELETNDVSVKQFGAPDHFIEHGDTESIKKSINLDNESVIESIVNFFKH